MKKFLIGALCLLLAGCAATQKPSLWGDLPEMQGAAGAQKTIRAAFLLPLTGKSEAVGVSFRNAGLLAINEYPDSPLELTFFDTKGTAAGAKAAWREARAYRPQIILGPIFSEEVDAVRSASPGDIPMIAFTSDDSLMDGRTHTMGLLIPDQVDRLVEFACVGGIRKWGVIGPEEHLGEVTMNALADAIKRCPGMEIAKVSLYHDGIRNFDPFVAKIVPRPIDPKKKDLTDDDRAFMAKPMSEKTGVDAVFVFEEGTKLRQIMSLLSFYDLTPSAFPVFGLSTLGQARDRSFVGAYFPGLSDIRYPQFYRRYRAAFQTEPVRIASMGYDAVSLLAVLARHNALDAANLANPRGFNGVDGRFRLGPDGKNERLLEMYQATARGLLTVSPAPDDYMPRDTPFIAPENPAEPPESAGSASESPPPSDTPDAGAASASDSEQPDQPPLD